jgi:2'-5' RNA ligase
MPSCKPEMSFPYLVPKTCRFFFLEFYGCSFMAHSNLAGSCLSSHRGAALFLGSGLLLAGMPTDSMQMRKTTATVYWLVPASPERELFRDFICILAKQFDAPPFEPHLTLFVTSRYSKKVLQQIKSRPIRLRVREIAWSPKFTKTLFVRFRSNRSLERLVLALGGESRSVRDPHVSLLYKKLPTRTKKALAKTIQLPFREVVFDSIKAVRVTLPVTTETDVESWRIVATKRLKK